MLTVIHQKNGARLTNGLCSSEMSVLIDQPSHAMAVSVCLDWHDRHPCNLRTTARPWETNSPTNVCTGNLKISIYDDQDGFFLLFHQDVCNISNYFQMIIRHHTDDQDVYCNRLKLISDDHQDRCGRAMMGDRVKPSAVTGSALPDGFAGICSGLDEF